MPSFWEQDQKNPFPHFNTVLKTRLFHQHLGSVSDKVERLVTLSTSLAQKLGIDPKHVTRAALLSKADLASQMVGEFPELQGIMGGRYYAHAQVKPLTFLTPLKNIIGLRFQEEKSPQPFRA